MVTIQVDEKTAKAIEMAATIRGLSVSEYVSSLVVTRNALPPKDTWRKFAIASLMIACTFGIASASTQRGGSGTRPSFDTLLAAFDADKNGELSQAEVPARVWLRLSAADGNKDGKVTRNEFDSYAR